MKIITSTSFKGGTGKTSCALHIGAALALYHKKKVLLVDFDPQANLSAGLNFGLDSLKTMGPVLKNQSKMEEVIAKTSVDGLDLIASNTFLDGIERSPELSHNPYSHELLRNALRSLEGKYDLIIVDTPPSLSWLSQSSFFASDYSIVCSTLEAFSVLGLERLKNFHEQINQYHKIEILGVVLSFWDERGATNQALIEKINESFPGKIFSSKIRRDISVSRSVLRGVPVFESDPNARAVEDYKALTEELLSRLNGVSPEKYTCDLNTKEGVRV